MAALLVDRVLAAHLRGMPLAVAAHELAAIAEITPEQRKANGLAAMCGICPPRTAAAMREYAIQEGYSASEADTIAADAFPAADSGDEVLRILQGFSLRARPD